MRLYGTRSASSFPHRVFRATRAACCLTSQNCTLTTGAHASFERRRHATTEKQTSRHRTDSQAVDRIRLRQARGDGERDHHLAEPSRHITRRREGLSFSPEVDVRKETT